jgi:translocation and assembly module TamB
MPDAPLPPETAAPAAPAPHHVGRSLLKWVAIGLGALLLLVFGLFLWLNSDYGRRYVVDQIDNLEMASGLDIDVERIEGSIFGDLKVHGLRLKDPKGQFFYAPVAEIEYRPLAYIRGNQIDIRSVVIPEARLWRLPELRPGDPNAPMLPDIDLDIGRLQIGRMAIDPAVTGYRHLLSLDGRAKISDGRAEVRANVGALVGPGVRGGDRMVLRLDAVPESNRLDLGLRIDAPANGFVSGLTGLKQPMRAVVDGRGSWENWNGIARADLAGKGLLDLRVGARNGTFTVTGPVAPNLVLTGPARALTAPFVQLNLETKLAQRRADTRLRLSSPAMALAADGLFDLGRNQFENVKVAARLSRPGAIAPGLRARDLRLAAVLNGPFATPFVAYDLQAASIGFNETTVEGLRARGRAKIDADRIMVPIAARARRITGLNPAVGGLLTNVSLEGTLAMSGSRIVSDDLRIRSDKVAITAVVAGDFATGKYQAGVQGRVNNYQVDGVGLLDLTTDIDVVTAAAGFGLQGRVAARTRRIDNESARTFLGGNATVSADVAMNPAGVINARNIRLNAPLFRLTSGTLVYRPNGSIDFRGAGVSTQYGPLAVVITGTVDQPQVQLVAGSPGFGIGLRDIRATVRATANGYAITATGQSDYGPFEADVVVLAGRGPMTIDVRRLTFAGMTFTGRVVKTAAGPFAGTLAMTGEGLTGTIQLAAAGPHQRADIYATASGAQIPGANPILIERGLIQASVILYPDAPHIVGDAQLAGVRSSNFALREARARIDYRGGSGTAQLVADGTSGVPFRVALNSQLSPNLIRAAAQGTLNRIPFRFDRPAELRKAGADWVLAPARIMLPQGEVLLAGRLGNGMSIQSRLRNVDLSMLNAFSPGLGLSGRASGSLDFAQPNGAAFPRADARLTIEDFSRTGIAVRSDPVNIALAAALRPEGGSLAAVIREDGAVVGRAQVRLQPVGGGGSWMQRLLAAPLAGGVRYNGPAEVLWSLSGMANQQLSGPIGVAADFTGRVQAPQLTGILRANNLTFVDETYGTRITNLALQGRFTSSTLEITRLSGKAGRGTIEGTGSVGFASAAGYPIDIRLNLRDAQLARSDNLGATVTGNVAVTNSRAGGALISGDLQLPEVRYQVVRQGAAQVVELAGVRRKGQPLPDPREIQQARADAVPSIWKLDLRLSAPNEVFIAGMGLESEWGVDLRVQGTSATPSIVGEAELVRGTYSFSGRRFDLTRGNIAFTGARPPNPRIDIAASADIEGVTVNIVVGGSALNPQIAFTSSPSLPQDELLARVLFGGSVTEISALQAVQLATSLNALRGGGGGLNPLGKLRSATGLDRLRILGADETTGRGTALAAGFYVSNDIYLEIITDARGFTATQLEIALSKALSVLSTVGTQGGTNVNLRYRKQY